MRLVLSAELVIIKELIPFFSAEDKQWILGRTAHRLYGFGKAYVGGRLLRPAAPVTGGTPESEKEEEVTR